MKQIIIAAILIIVSAVAGYGYYLWSTFPLIEHGGPSISYLLTNFQTMTVDVKFSDQDKSTQFLGLSQAVINDKALEIFAKEVRKKNSEIKFSHYGAPYSYETNPLNVKITFFLSRREEFSPWIGCGAIIQRALFDLVKRSKGPEYQLQNMHSLEHLAQKYSEEKIDESHQSTPRMIKNADELEIALEKYAKVVAASSVPNKSEAEKDEKEYFDQMQKKLEVK